MLVRLAKFLFVIFMLPFIGVLMLMMVMMMCTLALTLL